MKITITTPSPSPVPISTLQFGDYFRLPGSSARNAYMVVPVPAYYYPEDSAGPGPYIRVGAIILNGTRSFYRYDPDKQVIKLEPVHLEFREVI